MIGHFFFLSILIVNSSNYILQTLIFSSDMSYESLMSNTICTSLVYPIFAKIFNKINIYNLREEKCLIKKRIRSAGSKNQIINRRVFLLAAAKIVLFGGMAYRLFNLQISDREKYLLLSDKNRLREWKTPPQRGIITDYFNNVIAENDRVFQLHVNLEEVKDFNNLIVRLKTILKLNNNDLRYIYKKVKQT